MFWDKLALTSCNKLTYIYPAVSIRAQCRLSIDSIFRVKFSDRQFTLHISVQLPVLLASSLLYLTPSVVHIGGCPFLHLFHSYHRVITHGPCNFCDP